MHILHVDRLTINHAGRVIFRDLSWAIGDHDRIGLIGPNGAGKSSLLKAISGEIQADSGMVTHMNSIRIGCLPQEVHLTTGRTLLEEAMVLPSRLALVEEELADVEARLADPEVYGDSALLGRTLTRQEQILERYAALGGPQSSSRPYGSAAGSANGPVKTVIESATIVFFATPRITR